MSAVDPGKPDNKLAPGHARGDLVQRASIAQLLLVARLRARNRRDLAVDLLERATQVIVVTCKSWFSSGPKNAQTEEKNVLDVMDVCGISKESKESKDAHRHH
ncbi:MAG TPA: hypothetical protein VE934_01145 [Polaromonas sp.]|uniref:hypothetical protein n=1 Tax=Polaromonas sp. TaxID=1869339 RepID=UPI002D24EE51|nr:hypothetical protein [Polaromonas sp.]HYW55539.1 hypothetical protein [Polaromonas sp.]